MRHDDQLAALIADAHPRAFELLDARYRSPLVRYAGSLLRGSDQDAEDVVQEVLIRAYRALQRGHQPQQLKPWLYRICRNQVIDEARRRRRHQPLDDHHDVLIAADDDPASVFARREDLRLLVEDLARLPERQCQALLARAVDGLSGEATAEQLGVSVDAAHKLAARARDGLLRARNARDVQCEQVRADLADAHERGVRASELCRRHLSRCRACRVYRKELRRLHRQLHSLAAPSPWLLAGLGAKLVGGSAKTMAAAGAVAAASGGVVLLATGSFGPGAPAPFKLKGIVALTGREVSRNDRLPAGTTLVTARVRIPAGAVTSGDRRTVDLSCPQGTKVAGLQAPEQHVPLSYGLSRRTVIGHSQHGQIVFGRGRLPRTVEASVGLLCRRPHRSGSLAAAPRTAQAGEKSRTVCVDSTYVYRAPGKVFVGTVFRGQPVSVQRTRGTWAKVVTDLGTRGWVRRAELGRGC